jgi:spore germination protein GerM
MSTRTLVWRIVLGALVLLLVASVFVGLRVLRRLPDTVIYFVKSEETSFVLEPVFRRYALTQDLQLKAALEDLIAGPKASETAKKLFTSLPRDTTILDLKIERTTVTVNFSKGFAKEDGLANHQGRLYQVLYTLTQSQDIDLVNILVEGQPLNVLGGEGLMIDNPWWRENRKVLPSW